MFSRAILLSAGFGKRMKPFTEVFPKPLVPFFSVPILHRHIQQLKPLVGKLAVNAHHLADALQKDLSDAGLHGGVFFSHEKDEILGTAGFYSQLEDWRMGEDLLVVNSDIICQWSVFDLEEYVSDHPEADVIMVVRPYSLAGETVLCVDENQKLIQFGRGSPSASCKAFAFACIQYVRDRFICKYLSIPGPAEMVPIYRRALEEGACIKVYPMDGFWHDLGTPRRLFEAHQDYVHEIGKGNDFLGLLDEDWTLDARKSLMIEEGAHMAPNCEMQQGVILGRDSLIGQGCYLENCLVMPNVHVKPGQRLANQVIWDQGKISF